MLGPADKGGAKLRAMTDTPTTISPGLPRRLAALIYDILLVLPLIMLSVAAGLFLLTVLQGNADPVLNPHVVQLIALLCVMAFFSAFWRKKGQTLGMQAWRIQLVSDRGERVSLAQCLRRCLGAVVSAACLGAGYWWCLFDREGRYWHDRWSGTRLVLLPKKGQG